MKYGFVRVLFSGWVSVAGMAAAADEPSAKVVGEVKQATAFVEHKNGFGSGSAFCISPQGYFVTCAHVLHPLKIGDRVDLTLQSGLPGAKTLDATILRLAPDRDIAILKVEGDRLPFLRLGDSGKLRETQSILVAGFPLGRGLDAEGRKPAVTLSTGRVTAIRRDDERVNEVQVDAELNPGNSGGPIVDLEGRVVAVAASRIFLTELNFGIGTSWVEAIMASPLIRLEGVPPLPDGSETYRLPFSISYLRQPKEAEVWVTLNGAVTGEQALEIEPRGGGEFVASGVPKSSAAEHLSSTLRVDAVRELGQVTHTMHFSVLDQKVAVDGKEVRLSELAAVLPNGPEIIDVRGERRAGGVTGISSVRMAGESSGTVDLSRNYDALLIRPETAVPEEVKVSIKVLSDGFAKTLTLPVSREHADRFTNYPPSGRRAFSYGPGDASAGESKRLEFEAEVVEVAWGGGGRYAVLRLVRDPELRVIDCLEGREVGRVPFQQQGGCFTVGADRLILARGEEVEQWSLDPLEQVSKPQRWVLGEIDHLVMGPAWTGRVAVFYRAFGSDRLRRLDFRDPERSTVLAINPQGKMDDALTGVLPALLETAILGLGGRDSGKPMVWDGKGVRYAEERAGKYSAIGPLGRRRLPPGGVVVPEGEVWLPTTVPDLGLRLRPVGGEEQAVDLVDLRSGRQLAGSVRMLPRIGAKTPSGRPTGTEIPAATRVMAVPQLGFVACLPESNRELVIEPLDAWKAIGEAGSDVAFVTAFPPPSVARGKTLKFDLKPRGADEILARLESGPEGVEVTPEGLLEWKVPPGGSQAGPVIVRLTTKGGAEALWKWQPVVR